ncbi:MAG TPA: ATP-dependent DNA helicase, partial [Pseudomonadaceae bacterium]|nr:ATP-dependent DNA helicase [Pseudomonadaceae bacterium]
LLRLSGLLALQVEQALGELVSLGLVSSDNFTGLRALLTPGNNKPKAGSYGRHRALYGMADAGRWSLLDLPGMAEGAEPEFDDEQLERLIGVYLARWGVLSRRVLERETHAPPWRVLLARLRRMELRGELRGGRFIAGIGGEQFALQGTVEQLRKQQRQWQEAREEAAVPVPPQRVILNATDPLNLLANLLAEKRVAHLSGNRILFEDGVPVAVLEKETLRCLLPRDEVQAREYQQLLERRHFPPRLRAYIGRV